MSALAIAWEYLTGYAVATHPSRRIQAEWPPHPARMFMALTAALRESEPELGDEWIDRAAAALRWLEGLEDPTLLLPARGLVSLRSIVDVYVPVNDRAADSTAPLQSAPSMTRNRQPRTFPATYVGHQPCAMRWSNAPGADDHRAALDRLCQCVTRIGHSSSLVWAWVEDDLDRLAQTADYEKWEPSALAGEHLRRTSAGTLDALENRFNAPVRRAEELRRQAQAKTDEAAALKGNDEAEARNQLRKDAKALERQARETERQAPVRPTIGLWTAYTPTPPDPSPSVSSTVFDSDMLILVKTAGPDLPAEATLQVARALRGTTMRFASQQPVPIWVSGHREDGTPDTDTNGHLAFATLPFVGHPQADGHLMGAALVFPRSIGRRERRVVAPLIVNPETGEPQARRLLLGSLGEWEIQQRAWDEPRHTLAAETWTANPAGARTWASVTPVVLDRFPKADHDKQRSLWEAEVEAIVRQACLYVGLPDPELVDLGTTCWHLGGPRAIGKRRPLRRQPGMSADADAPLGSGFPAFANARQRNDSASQRPPKPQIHVWLRFGEPVVGPVLLGSGRYLGYGLCKPLDPREGS